MDAKLRHSNAKKPLIFEPASARPEPETTSALHPQRALALSGTWAAPFLTGLALLALLWACLAQCGMELTYTLDDPYIHLALARNIQNGTYGINPGEWASPSSSVLWPFFMAAFPAAYMEWGPLLVNSACCLISAWMLEANLQTTALQPRLRAALAFALAVGMNLLGLVMTGMEHSLQVMLTLLVAWHLSRQKVSNVTYIALALMPCIRYECMAITYPALVYLWLKGERTRVLVTGALCTSVIVGFSLTLHAHGLPWLPCSVIAKSETARFITNWKNEPALIALIGWLAYHHLHKRLELVLLILLPAAGYFALGSTGWFGRYETFMVAYLCMFAITSLGQTVPNAQESSTRHPAEKPALMVLVLAASFPSLLSCTTSSPAAAKNIWQQQAVMASLAKQLGEPVAVYDLGLIALRSGQKVLDLGGLGSYEALLANKQSKGTSSEWIHRVMDKHGVQYAFLSEKLFPVLPNHWIKVADLVLTSQLITPFSNTVSLFATTDESALRLKALLHDYQRHNPQGSMLKLHPIAAATHNAQVSARNDAGGKP